MYLGYVSYYKARPHTRNVIILFLLTLHEQTCCVNLTQLHRFKNELQCFIETIHMTTLGARTMMDEMFIFTTNITIFINKNKLVIVGTVDELQTKIRIVEGNGSVK